MCTHRGHVHAVVGLVRDDGGARVAAPSEERRRSRGQLPQQLAWLAGAAARHCLRHCRVERWARRALEDSSTKGCSLRACGCNLCMLHGVRRGRGAPQRSSGRSRRKVLMSAARQYPLAAWHAAVATSTEAAWCNRFLTAATSEESALSRKIPSSSRPSLVRAESSAHSISNVIGTSRPTKLPSAIARSARGTPNSKPAPPPAPPPTPPPAPPPEQRVLLSLRALGSRNLASC